MAVADLLKALSLSLGQAALDMHQKTCEVCSGEHDCVIAKAHLRKLAALSTPPRQERER